MPTNVSRRMFVCGGCAALTGCQVTHVPLVFDSSGTSETGEPAVKAPNDEYPCGQSVPTGPARIALPLADYPALTEVGGSVAIQAGGRPMIVAHALDGCFVAIDRACTHQGILVNYRADRAQFVCPEHGAIYALDGSIVAGPQPRALAVYPAARDGDTVYIDVDQ